MLNIKTFQCNLLTENCYVVSDETKECVIIDCGAHYSEEGSAIVGYINDNGLTPKHLLCTHGHFDHCMGNGYIYRNFGLKPEAHVDDQFLMEKMEQQTQDILGIRISLDVPPMGRYLTDSDIITFGTHKFSILHTPGHTPGGIVFYCEAEKTAFSGDTLFRMSIGRTDFERGSYEEMIDSLQNVMAKLPADTTVYPGHGPKTTIADELRYNPYMR
ncbi:MAG: MBL fold metallo-hydrolase [Prevotella sp.]|nr:MBL fold metallo-hydrolase [Prevotella sp.]